MSPGYHLHQALQDDKAFPTVSPGYHPHQALQDDKAFHLAIDAFSSACRRKRVL